MRHIPIVISVWFGSDLDLDLDLYWIDSDIYLRWTYLDSTTAYVQTISRKNNKNNNDFYKINFVFFILSFNRILYISTAYG